VWHPEFNPRFQKKKIRNSAWILLSFKKNPVFLPWLFWLSFLLHFLSLSSSFIPLQPQWPSLFRDHYENCPEAFALVVPFDWTLPYSIFFMTFSLHLDFCSNVALQESFPSFPKIAPSNTVSIPIFIFSQHLSYLALCFLFIFFFCCLSSLLKC
jgi:hypothetical protein